VFLGGAGSRGVSGWAVRARIPEVGVGNCGGIWGWEAPGGRQKTTGERRQSGKERRIGAYRDSSMSTWVAPVPLRELIENFLCLRGWHLFWAPVPPWASIPCSPDVEADLFHTCVLIML
jgi:hypothetical protein